MYGMAVAYCSLQYLFSLSRYESAPFMIGGTCILFLILSNLMMRLRVGNAAFMTFFFALAGLWMFARQGASPGLVLCCTICTFAVAASTLYLNFFIGNYEMYYMRQEQHFGLVLSGGKRDLWEFDSISRVFNFRPWNAITSQASVSHSYNEYLALVHPGHRPDLIRAIEDCVAGRAEGLNVEYLVCLPGESAWRWLHLVAHGQRAMNGIAARLIGTTCDITDRKALHAQVEQKSHELQEAARQKAEFLATMSHTIRTPLNAVVGAASMLATDDLDGEALEMAETIQRSGQLLLTVLNDFLDVGSLCEGPPRLELVTFDPSQVIRQSFELVSPLGRRKHLELRCTSPPELHSRLTGDPVRLQQILINLLSNAIKFTERGSVSLSASVEATSGHGIHAVTFAVTDTGIGIEEHAQHMIFERFEQAHLQTAPGQTGTGLGLAISKRLVEAMGGHIVCHSKPGEGSRFEFTVRFPVVETETIKVGTAARMAEPGGGSAPAAGRPRVRALVAEDNPVNQQILTSMLARLNCETRVARNGAEAVEACCCGSFDVIFMDCDMPVLNGLDATRRIRELPQFSTVPIIAATAHALPANLDACLAAGMSDVLTKPLTLAHLVTALHRWAGGDSEPVPAKRSA